MPDTSIAACAVWHGSSLPYSHHLVGDGGGGTLGQNFLPRDVSGGTTPAFRGRAAQDPRPSHAPCVFALGRVSAALEELTASRIGGADA